MSVGPNGLIYPPLPQELYQELLDRLSRLRARKESLSLQTALFSGLTAVILLAVLAVLVEAISHLTIPGRTIAFWSWLGLSLGALVGFLAEPLLIRFGLKRRSTDDDLARAVGNHYPTIQDRLVNSLQLARSIFESGTGYRVPGAQPRSSEIQLALST
jgi:hypothetical protein